MKKIFFVLTIALACAGLTMAQTPTLTGMVNAASYASGIARGSLFVAFGTNMGPSTLTLSPAPPWQTTLSGTSVKFTPVSGGTTVDAFLYYTSAGQLAGVLPSTATAGEYNATVTYNGATSAPLKLNVVDRNFGILSNAGTGAGPGVIQNYVGQGEAPARNLFGTPVHPGGTLILWGTGLGPVTIPDNQAPGALDLRGQVNVAVLVGGREIQPFYAGRAPEFPGTDQINFTLPGDIETGCIVPVQIRVGSAVSNTTSLSISGANDAVCKHPFLSDADLRRLDAGGSITFGAFSLTRQVTKVSVGPVALDSLSESIGGEFGKYTAANVAQAGALTTAVLNPSGSCTVIHQTTQGGTVTVPGLVALDAGPQLTLNGPGVANRAVKQVQGEKAYAEPLSSGMGGAGVIAQGRYTLTGTGGADVGAFTAAIDAPTPLTWTNIDAISEVNRSSNLTVTWTGGAAGTIATLVGTAGTRDGGTDEDPIFKSSVFICTAPATAGTLTVSRDVLSQLPATGSEGIGFLALNNNTVPPNGVFTAPLTAGGNIEYGAFTASSGAAKTVSFK